MPEKNSVAKKYIFTKFDIQSIIRIHMINELLSRLDKFLVDRPGLMASGRVTSVDALRGFDMFWIIGGGTVFRNLENVFISRDAGFISRGLILIIPGMIWGIWHPSVKHMRL